MQLGDLALILGAFIAIIFGAILLACDHARCINRSLHKHASCASPGISPNSVWPSGGYKTGDVPYATLAEYLSPADRERPLTKCKFHYEGWQITTDGPSLHPGHDIILMQIPFIILVNLISLKDGKELASLHGGDLGSHVTKALIKTYFSDHLCPLCVNHLSKFSVVYPKSHLKVPTNNHIRLQTKLRVQ